MGVRMVMRIGRTGRMEWAEGERGEMKYVV